MHKYIFNVSAERMSNYPVIEQSVCSAVINYAIFTSAKHIETPQSRRDLCPIFSAGLVVPRPKQEQGGERAVDSPNPGFQPQWSITWARIESSPSSQSASVWPASLSVVSGFPESITCYSEPSAQGGCIPAFKEKPMERSEKAKGTPNRAPCDLSSASSG